MEEGQTTNACIGFWNCISPDAWLTGAGTLLGAFTGALLAGLITYKVMRRQIDHDKLKERRREISDHLKINTHFRAHVSAVIELSKKMNDFISEGDFINPDWCNTAIKRFKLDADSFKSTYDQLQQLDERLLTFEFFRNYLGCKITIINMHHSLELAAMYLEDENSSYLIYVEDFRRDSSELERIFNPIVTLSDGFEEELNKINKKLNS